MHAGRIAQAKLSVWVPLVFLLAAYELHEVSELSWACHGRLKRHVLQFGSTRKMAEACAFAHLKESEPSLRNLRLRLPVWSRILNRTGNLVVMKNMP